MWLIFPLDQEVHVAIDLLVIEYRLDFEFFIAINQFRNWIDEVLSMLISLVIWCEKGSMEDIVNLLLASKV